MLKKKEDSKSLKIGVLLPQSKEYPSVSREFLDGLKLYFTINENQFPRGQAELIVEDVGFGTERATNEKVRKLVAQDEVSIIVGLLEFNTAFQVGLVADLMGVPSLFVGLGESAVPRMDLPDSSFFYSMEYWKSWYLSGKYVRENLNDGKVHIITSFYDCGYDPLRSFRHGVGFDLIGRETILKSYTGDELIKEIDNEVELKKGERLVLLLHPDLLDTFISNYGEYVEGAVINPFYQGDDEREKYWSFSSVDKSSEAYGKFATGVKDYLESTVRTHHVLGFVTGQIVYDAISKLNGSSKEDATVISETLKNYQKDSIAGSLKMNIATHEIESFMQICKGNNTFEDNEVILTTKLTEEDLSNVADIFLTKNSFTNPYLFF